MPLMYYLLKLPEQHAGTIDKLHKFGKEKTYESLLAVPPTLGVLKVE